MLYDAFCDVADGIMAIFGNPCSFVNGKCVRGHDCCTIEPGCPKLDPEKGCTVRNLPCKLWFCKVIRDEQPDLANIMASLDSKAKELLPSLTFHTSREEYEKKLIERDDLETSDLTGRASVLPNFNKEAIHG